MKTAIIQTFLLIVQITFFAMAYGPEDIREHWAKMLISLNVGFVAGLASAAWLKFWFEEKEFQS